MVDYIMSEQDYNEQYVLLLKKIVKLLEGKSTQEATMILDACKQKVFNQSVVQALPQA